MDLLEVALGFKMDRACVRARRRLPEGRGFMWRIHVELNPSLLVVTLPAAATTRCPGEPVSKTRTATHD